MGKAFPIGLVAPLLIKDLIRLPSKACLVFHISGRGDSRLLSHGCAYSSKGISSHNLF